MIGARSAYHWPGEVPPFVDPMSDHVGLDFYPLSSGGTRVATQAPAFLSKYLHFFCGDNVD